MTEYAAPSAVEPMTDPIVPPSEPALPPITEPPSDVAATSHATSYDGGTNSQLPIWRPTEPQFTKAIAEYYGVSRKSVQQWFQKVKEACPWFAEMDLKLADDRYTPLCIELMGDYRISGLPLEAWKAQIWEQNPELVVAFQASQPHASSTQPPDTPTGLSLHDHSGLPTIASLVEGDEAAYLSQMQNRLQRFEQHHQQVLTQMQKRFQQSQELNAQYQEALSLSDQLLLQEFQLKGVQLGYTALELKQQAFKATVQAAEAGNLPSLGKS